MSRPAKKGMCQQKRKHTASSCVCSRLARVCARQASPTRTHHRHVLSSCLSVCLGPANLARVALGHERAAALASTKPKNLHCAATGLMTRVICGSLEFISVFLLHWLAITEIKSTPGTGAGEHGEAHLGIVPHEHCAMPRVARTAAKGAFRDSHGTRCPQTGCSARSFAWTWLRSPIVQSRTRSWSNAPLASNSARHCRQNCQNATTSQKWVASCAGR